MKIITWNSDEWTFAMQRIGRRPAALSSLNIPSKASSCSRSALRTRIVDNGSPYGLKKQVYSNA